MPTTAHMFRAGGREGGRGGGGPAAGGYACLKAALPYLKGGVHMLPRPLSPGCQGRPVSVGEHVERLGNDELCRRIAHLRGLAEVKQRFLVVVFSPLSSKHTPRREGHMPAPSLYRRLSGKSPTADSGRVAPGKA